MPPSPYATMAKELMDLWQKQMSSVVGDKQFLHAMLEMIQTMQMPNAQPNTATSTPQSTDASGNDASDYAQLAYRLAACEQRLAALEKRNAGSAETQKRAKKPTRRSQKPRS